jgi:hypothetical protein
MCAIRNEQACHFSTIYLTPTQRRMGDLITFFNQNASVQTETHNESTCFIRTSITEFINVTMGKTSFPKRRWNFTIYIACVFDMITEFIQHSHRATGDTKCIVTLNVT